FTDQDFTVVKGQDFTVINLKVLPCSGSRLRRAKTAISNSLKREICEYSNKFSHEIQSNIANYFNQKNSILNIDRSTISKILKEKKKWLVIENNETSMTTFRHNKVKFLLLDKAIQLWVEQVISGQIFLTDLIIKEKAAFFAWVLGLPDSVLKFSNGWIYKFKKQNKLRNYRLHREANSAPMEILPEQRIKFHSTTSNALIATTIRIEKDVSESDKELNSEKEELESENSDNEDDHASSSRNSTRCGR
ncbi:937_t:CDS:2, partial [Racocetra persica]